MYQKIEPIMRSEVEKYQLQLETLISFVEGRLDGFALDEALATEEMQTLLSVFEVSRYPASSNHFRRLNCQNRTSLGGLTNSEGIIEQFLQQAEVDFSPSKRFFNASVLIHQSMPDYVDPPMEFMMENIVPSETNLSDARKKKIIRERIKEQFRFMDKPPKWIQNADWPIQNGKPLIFVGQVPVDAPDFFHDKGAAYVFYNPTNGEFHTVSQFH